ncbi:40S ribosomal protein S5-1 [Hordeum vulgare]|nr:40S ribosomal protein S5-1 [Hordeum vulgare]
MKHPKAIEIHERVLHIRDFQGPKKTRTMEAKLEAVEREILRCQGLVECGRIITELTRDQKVDGRSWKDIDFTLNKKINFLQGKIFDLENQILEYEARFKDSA